MAMPGSPWVQGQPQEGAIPTALVLLAAAFQGWVQQIFLLEVGQMFCFKRDLRKTQDTDFFIFLAANSLSSDGQLQ